MARRATSVPLQTEKASEKYPCNAAVASLWASVERWLCAPSSRVIECPRSLGRRIPPCFRTALPG
jgi:hypothetical protein